MPAEETKKAPLDDTSKFLFIPPLFLSFTYFLITKEKKKG